MIRWMLLIALIIPLAGKAQTDCGEYYTELLNKAKNHFEDGFYRQAYEEYRAARGCKGANLALIDKQMDAAMQGVEQQRLEAKKSEEKAIAATIAAQRAIMAQIQAQMALKFALEEAQLARDSAQALQKHSDSLAQAFERQFVELQNANKERIVRLLGQSKGYLTRMQYDSAYLVCQAIYSIPEGHKSGDQLLFELLFYFNESEQRELAKNAMQMLPECSTEYSREGIRQLLKTWNAAWWDDCMSRYYPVTLPVQGGYFLMGADLVRDGKRDLDAPLHYEAVKSFQVGKTELTNRQYQLFAKAKLRLEWLERLKSDQTADHPAGYITWFDALNYLNWISLQQNMNPCYELRDTVVNKTEPTGEVTPVKYTLVKIKPNANGFRLPTEVEWEYAARGGQASQHSRFAGSQNHNELAGEKGKQFLVGQFKPNELGLFDMTSSQAEWCWDEYKLLNVNDNVRKGYLEKEGPQQARVNRGSNYKEGFRYGELSQRDMLNAEYITDEMGFRVVRPYPDSLAAREPQTLAAFPSGVKDMTGFVFKEFEFMVEDIKNLPESLRSTTLTPIEAEFTVAEDGSITGINLTSSRRYSVPPEIMSAYQKVINDVGQRFFRKMPKWKPAQLNGKPVASTIKLLMIGQGQLNLRTSTDINNVYGLECSAWYSHILMAGSLGKYLSGGPGWGVSISGWPETEFQESFIRNGGVFYNIQYTEVEKNFSINQTTWTVGRKSRIQQLGNFLDFSFLERPRVSLSAMSKLGYVWHKPEKRQFNDSGLGINSKGFFAGTGIDGAFFPGETDSDLVNVHALRFRLTADYLWMGKPLRGFMFGFSLGYSYIFS